MFNKEANTIIICLGFSRDTYLNKYLLNTYSVGDIMLGLCDLISIFELAGLFLKVKVLHWY
jgi:hypothetical protein